MGSCNSQFMLSDFTLVLHSSSLASVSPANISLRMNKAPANCLAYFLQREPIAEEANPLVVANQRPVPIVEVILRDYFFGAAPFLCSCSAAPCL